MRFFLFIPTCAPLSLWCNTTLDLKKVFAASPLIYSALLLMSVVAMTLWLYSLFTFRYKRIVHAPLVSALKASLQKKEWENALSLCETHPGPLTAIICVGLKTRALGTGVMLDAMKTEAKRVSTPLWQRLSLLNDIAIVSPMLGLLGTVIGMFYAFYDVNRSIESIHALFDGLGIAVGTTVLGLIVAILCMLFSTTLKYRFLKTLSHAEAEAVTLFTLLPAEVYQK
ncbi:MAG: MotA/TolQ/ExbB proton channel family protein [Verrucomicrobiota bacterium]|nr:MotA/TolQ/ExbB proton channel family protein [Verrucomicrobiota bacterium]